VDPEEEMFRKREEAILKQREARAERLRQLEREEEEAARAAKAEEERKAREARAERLRQLEREEEEMARAEEERIQARLRARTASSTTASVVSLSTRSPSPVLVASPTPPPPPPAPPTPTPATPVMTPPEVKSSTNPFSRLMKESGATPPAAGAGTNPWAAASSTASTPAATSPATAARTNPFPAPVKTPYNTASSSITDDWEDIKENPDDSDSDDDIATSRNMRENIAKQLFGNILPAAGPARPQSAAGGSRSGTPATPVSAGAAAPPPPPPPPGPPPPPAPPMAPPAPFAAAAASAPASAPGDVSALMRSIQGGMKLRKAVTVDKSAPPVSGKVIGDTAPPSHINAAPRPVSPPAMPEAPLMSASSSNASNRQSVDWYAGLASDATPPVERMPVMKEGDEYEEPYAPVPDINVVEPVSDLMADIDKSTGGLP
jgi:hypothetical protein